MTNLDFGKQLRFFRQQCHDPKTGKAISQQKLGELLGVEMADYGFSGAAVSDWERNQSEINANARLVLISLTKILKEYGGIKTVADANLLLESGNYRALNEVEKSTIFPEGIQEVGHTAPKHSPHQQSKNMNFLLNNTFFNSPGELQQLLDEANEGPPPAWPRFAIALINRMTSHWTIYYVLKALIWLWIWALSYLLIEPSLQWSKASFQAMFLYASGTIILPALIGALVNTKDSEFWKEKKTSNSLTIRLYVHQGAYIGFHLGYFFLLPLALIQNWLDFHTTISIEFVKMLIPILISYAGAQLIPYNLWRAYKRLDLKDGVIFFVFVLLGPLWAWFFLKFNASIGVFTVLAAATLLTTAMAIQYRRKGNTVIPLLWVIVFYGLISICQIALFFIR